MTGLASPAVYVIPPLMGVAAYLVLQNLWIWHGRRTEPLHLWVSIWCANSLLFLTSHYLQIASALPGQAVLGGRLAWTSAIVLIGVTIGLSHALAGVRLPRRLGWPVGVLNAGLLLLVWLTDLLVTGRAYVRTDLLGSQYGAPAPGPLLPVMVPYILAAFAYAWRTLGRGEMNPGERRAIRAGVAVYVVLALNDMLHAARLIQSIRVFDLGFVAVGVGLTYMLVRRYNRLYAHLEDEVSVRTQAVYAREKETAVLALDNARLYETARRRETRLATLARLAQSLTATLSLEEVLDRVVRHAVTLFDSGVARLWLLDDEGQTLTLRAHAGDRAAVDTAATLRLGEGFVGRIAETRSALVMEDIQQDPRPENAGRLRAESIVSFAGVPLTLGGQVLGALGIGTRERRRFPGEDVSLLQSLADHGAVAIANARLHEGLARRLARVETLARLTRLVSASLDRDSVLREISRSAALLVGVPVANFWLADEERRTLELAGVSGPVLEADWPVRVLSFDQGTAGWVATHRHPLNVPDALADERAVEPDWWRTHGLGSYHGVPVLHEGSLLGVLSLLGVGPIRLELEDEALLEAFVAPAAVAIQNASLYASAQAQARELRALHGVGAAVVSSLDISSVLGAITASAMELTGAGGSAVFELEPAEGLLHLRASRGIDESRTPSLLRLGQGAAGAAALRREPVWSPDVSVQPLPGYEEEAPGAGKPLGEAVRELSYRGMLGVPLLSRDMVFGAICLYWYEAHSPEEQEIHLLTAFAQQAAVALENARLHSALGRRLGRMETLARLTRVLSSSLDRDRILGEIARAAAELADARFVAIWLADEATQTLTLGSVSDPGINADWAPTTLPFGRSGVGWIAAHRRALRVDDTFADERFLQPDWRRRHGLKAFLGMPVMHEGTLVAVLSLGGPQPFSREPEDEALLSAFTAQAAVAIGNASLYEAEAQARRAAELALAQVKQLQGMLPICAYCKKIRDDSNYWQTIEAYIGERSAATFSHGICPDCREKIVKPELERWRREQGKDR